MRIAVLGMLGVAARGQFIPPPILPPPVAGPSAAQPNQRIFRSRPNAPPTGEWNISAVTQTVDGPWRHLRGHAEMENAVMLFRADELDYNDDTHDVEARGNVYFEQFERNEKVWADHLEYNTETEKGKFYDVRGTSAPRIDTRPGVLTSTNPYYFQGAWAERVGEKYIFHDGFLTNCKVPHPWWRLKGPRFEVVPGESAKAYKSVFLLQRFPLFFSPFFYKSLEKEPRRTGFLMPNIGHSSLRGYMLGAGFFWAINRSYDATYHIQYFTIRGPAHHLELRGKPSQRSDFDAIVFGVQDRGLPQPDGTRLKQGGLSVTAVAKADLRDGFYARGSFNYLTSYTFRAAFSDTFNEAVFSEVNSVGYVDKSWSTFVFDAVAERQDNYQSLEITASDPVTGRLETLSNSIIIRKLPELDFSSRDRQILRDVPLWFSFDSSGGFLYRSQPYFQGSTLTGTYQTGHFSNRFRLAPEITTAFHWKDFHLIPSFSVDETFYSQSQTPFQDRFRVISTSLLRSAREFHVDLILPSLERTFNKKTWLGDKLKHAIEPRVTYQNVAGIGPDFNRLIRFDETDLLSNTNELVGSLTNRLYAKRGDNVMEVFSWELAQARYFDPTFGGVLLSGQRNVLLSTVELTPFTFLSGPRTYSPVVSILRASPAPGYSLEWRADYDPARGRIVDSGFTADFRKSYYFLSVGQNQVHSDPLLTPQANQLRATIGAGNQTRRGWNAAFVAIYDYHLQVLQYAIIQGTYNTDCCGFSVQFRRFDFGTRFENQYRFAFAVANLGSFGSLRKQERLF